jgi:hypothetical protein
VVKSARRVKGVKRLVKLNLIIVVCTLTIAMICKVGAQVPAQNVKTFFNSEMPGIEVQANATAETRPTENLTVWLLLTPQTTVYVESLRLDIFGFLNGTDKVSIGNITDYNFSLNGNSTEYSMTFAVPDRVWGVTFGEITLTYSANLGGLELRFPNATSGFYMTQVDNTFVESLVTQLRGLNESYDQLNDSYYNLTGKYLQLNQTFVQLQQNYTTLQGNMNELDNTRRVAVILAITTVFFVATTVFVVMRRPRESW